MSANDKLNNKAGEVPGDELEKDQTNNTEVPQAAEISEPLNTEEAKLETDFVSKEREPASELQFVGGEKLSKRSYASVLVDGPEKNESEQTKETEVEVEGRNHVPSEEGDDDEEGDLIYFGRGNSSRKVVEESEAHDNSRMIDGEVVTDSDEGDSDEEGDGNEPFDSAA